MAEPTKAKKVSRRRAMAILGSGAAVGAVWESVELDAISCTKPATAIVLRPPRPGVTQGTSGGGGVLQAFSCCEQTRAVIMQAAQKPTVGGKHLKPIAHQLDLLGQGALEEYCVMVWGLTDAQREDLMATVKQRTSVWFGK